MLGHKSAVSKNEVINRQSINTIDTLLLNIKFDRSEYREPTKTLAETNCLSLTLSHYLTGENTAGRLFKSA